jgi:hypothetical protein
MFPVDGVIVKLVAFAVFAIHCPPTVPATILADALKYW